LLYFLGPILTQFSRKSRRPLKVNRWISSIQLRESSVRRSRWDIMAGILRSCAVEQMTTNRLIRVHNLSYKVLRPILESLVSHGLIDCVNENSYRYFVTTERGLTALSVFDSALALLNGEQVQRLSSRYRRKTFQAKGHFVRISQ